MPVLKFQHVHSFSSEDPNNPADNLLSEDTFRKWSCANAGEKQASVVLQLEKASLINAIDIGNDGSAFVEALVSRSGDDGKNYEVLLVTSSFMSPAESKSWTNTNRVRMFGKEKLSKSVASQKWDRLKLVCTQPYNKTEKYGLSFVKLHSPAEPSNEEPMDDITIPNPLTFGGFSLRDEAKTLSPGSLFHRRDKSDSSSTSVATAAAQARMASREAEKEAAAHMGSPVASKHSHSTRDTKKHTTANADSWSPSITASHKEDVASKRSAPNEDSEIPKKKPKETAAEEDKVLTGVTFALSGFKNPYRGELRDKATALGARYAPDWGPSCTHLICAFTNTPKFNQVKDAGGLIVRKEWIIDCHHKKTKLPTDKYQMTNSDDRDSSEDDKASPPYYRKGDILSNNSKKGKGKAPVKKSPMKTVAGPSNSEVTDLDPYGGSTDEEGASPKFGRISPRVSSSESDGGDTEDEIRRIKVKQNKEDEEDPYGGSTDEEAGDKEATESVATRNSDKKSLLDLPNLFSKYCFFLYGDFTDSYRKMIIRYITAYDGDIAEYMGDKVTHIITNSKWDDNFDEALADNSSLMFVKPKWIFACHDKQKLVPSQPYIVAPS